jgi:tRNA1Val (adenine37-N6)-methyltransferase
VVTTAPSASTPDSFGGGRIRIRQPRCGYRFSIDAVLLAGHVAPGPSERIVDLGTGCGVVALLLACGRPQLRVWGIELQPELAALAAENVRDNGWSDRVSILQADLQVIGPAELGGPVDRVVANPPYRRARSGRINPDGQRALARHEIAVTLPGLTAAARRLLRTGGRLHLVYAAERTAELLGGMRADGIEPKRLRPVQSRADEDAALVLVEGIKGARPGMTLSPPLVVYAGEGRYTEEVELMFRSPPPVD